MHDIMKIRFLANERLPYMTKLSVSANLISTTSVETMSTDCYLRIYYNPRGIGQWSELHASFVFIHELFHIFLRHDKRSRVKLGEKPSEIQRKLWNIAGDMSINRIIRGIKVRNVPSSRSLLPAGAVDYADKKTYPFPLPENGTTEQYYDILIENQKKVPTALMACYEIGGECDSGSGADGQARPWELSAPEDRGNGEAYGADEFDREQLERGVAAAIKDDAKKRVGSVPGELVRIAEQILTPQFDPRREILHEVKYAINCIKGFGQSTWKLPNRRTPPGGLRLPANIRPIPQPIVIIDTSGSMNQTDLGLALGVVASVIKCLPSQDGVHVISGDTHVGRCQRAFGPNIELVGGGGTDMGAIMIQAVEQYPKADVIIVVTDGYTPWPKKPLGPKCLALVTSDSDRKSAPGWIREIFIRRD